MEKGSHPCFAPGLPCLCQKSPSLVGERQAQEHLQMRCPWSPPGRSDLVEGSPGGELTGKGLCLGSAPCELEGGKPVGGINKQG